MSGVIASCVAAAIVMPAAATAAPIKTVRYGTYALRVPATWPVFRLASDPSACVRFDRHAVYLGRPGSAQRCPAHAVGRTEAILVEPLTASAAQAGSAPALRSARTAKAGGSVRELVVPGRGVVVTATWGSHPGTITRALGVPSMPSVPSSRAAGSAGRAVAPPDAVSHARQIAGSRSQSSGRARVHALNIGGLGFDTCSAPSTNAMSAWLQSSPFRAVAIYIGGTNSACAQPNLSASWVSTESAAGWQFIPTYVGLQAPTSSCGCAVIAPAQATAEGTAAAGDAVAQAQALGIGPGNPIYNDMEAYTQTSSATSAVLAFLSAWTSGLHAYGYVSGVYSSGSSGITDFVGALGTSFVAPDDLWIADWNNQATASDPYVPAADWPDNQRLHQYRGGHIDNYGGVQMDIDTDFLDGATATAGSGSGVVSGALPDGTFVTYGGKIYRLAGGAPVYVHSWSAYGAPQTTVALTPAQWTALNPVPANGTFIRATATGKVYRIAGGFPIYVSSWSAFGGPHPTVTVDRWNILNITSPDAHLRAAPADGTIVQGLPSGQFWQFTAGMRAPTAASATAVIVNDAGLGPLLESPTASHVRLFGVGKQKPKLRVTVTAGANAPAITGFAVELPAGLTFSRSASFSNGLAVWSAGGKLLAAVAKVRHGVLWIRLEAPTMQFRIVAAMPALSASTALAAAVRTRAVTTLPVVVTLADAKHHGAVLTLNPGAS